LRGWARTLRRNVKRFRGGLVFKAHRLLYHSTLGLRVIKKKKRGWARTLRSEPIQRQGCPSRRRDPGFQGPLPLSFFLSRSISLALSLLLTQRPEPSQRRGRQGRWQGRIYIYIHTYSYIYFFLYIYTYIQGRARTQRPAPSQRRGRPSRRRGRRGRAHPVRLCVSWYEAGSYLRRIDSCITQRKAQGHPRT